MDIMDSLSCVGCKKKAMTTWIQSIAKPASDGEEGAGWRGFQVRVPICKEGARDCEVKTQVLASQKLVEAVGGSSLPKAKACRKCGAEGKRLQLCSRCKRVQYCSPEFQKAHYGEHRVFCKAATSEDGMILQLGGEKMVAWDMKDILAGLPPAEAEIGILGCFECHGGGTRDRWTFLSV